MKGEQVSGFDPFDDFRMHDHVAIVTGGAQNIGAAIARSLAGAGAKVVIADLDADKAKATAESIEEQTRSPVLGLGCDVTSDADIQASSVHDGGGGVVPPVTCTAPGRTYADVTREVWTQTRPSGVVAGFASASGSRAASTEMRFRGGQPAAVTDSEGTRCSGGDAGRVVPDGGHVRGNRLGRQPPPGVPARPDRGVAR